VQVGNERLRSGIKRLPLRNKRPLILKMARRARNLPISDYFEHI
jgi:hypothetical protein